MSISMLGNVGNYVDDNNVISFQIGSSITMDEPLFERGKTTIFTPSYQTVDGYKVCSRGSDNRDCERVEAAFKSNRLLPRLIDKQFKFLYGKGIGTYIEKQEGDKSERKWIVIPEWQAWLDSWESNGIETGYAEFAKAIVRRFYFHRDIFTKIRMSNGKVIGSYPIAGLEMLENKNCRLATTKQDVVTDTVSYSDFRFVMFGNWHQGGAKYKVYPLFRINEVGNYQYAAISHHRENTPSSFYGVNDVYEGVRTFLKTSNELPEYIDSFLSNSLAAKVHVTIPNAWIESKRKQIKTLCDENKKRKTEGRESLKYNSIEIGTEFKESTVIQYMNIELRRLSEYLSGAKNQGKIFSSISFRSGHGSEEEMWKIEPLDLKYKEYIEALISVDKRVDEILLSSIGLDSSITSVSKPGMISKSGSDAYYNLIIYLLSLVPDDETCSEPFNLALRVNFPDIYASGVRVGFRREIPSRQENISKDNRIEEQEV